MVLVLVWYLFFLRFRCWRCWRCDTDVGDVFGCGGGDDDVRVRVGVRVLDELETRRDS